MNSAGFTQRSPWTSQRPRRTGWILRYPPFVFIIRSIGFLLVPTLTFSNNLELGQLHLTAPNQISFQVSWENSWYLSDSVAPGNHDAVWVFVKVRDQSGGWLHATLATDPSQYQASPGIHLQTVSDGMGIFVRRKHHGSGTISGSLTLPLVQPISGSVSGIEIHGVEMVYVPETTFFLGDGEQFHHFRQQGSSDPYVVDSEQVIAFSEISVGNTAEVGGDIPVAWPKGFGPFYAMKYEITQEQYVVFLNRLTYAQQASRTQQSPDSPRGLFVMSTFNPFRNGIVIDQPGIAGTKAATYACNADGDNAFDEPEDGQPRACNFLTWRDVLAYLDWTGLRPLTEMEFEKLCRGPELPVAREFAWGTAQVVDANTILKDGTSKEPVSEHATTIAGLASHGYMGPSGPLRNGFGGHDSSDRLQIGAGYYGATELSGNLWEPCVSVRASGLSFTGQHGDGLLDIQGDADVQDWPLTDGGILRGGAHNSGIIGEFRDLAISDRFYHDLHPDQRRNTTGGRGGRSGE